MTLGERAGMHLLERGHLLVQKCEETKQSASWSVTLKAQNKQAVISYLKACKGMTLGERAGIERGHLVVQKCEKTKWSASWNATAKPQNKQAVISYLKACKEIKLGSVFFFQKIEFFCLTIEQHLVDRSPRDWKLPTVAQTIIQN